MSSTLQNEKTKMDAKALAHDAERGAAGVGQKISETVHKAGVKLGVAQPTAGEQVGKGVEKTIDTLTGKHDPTI